MRLDLFFQYAVTTVEHEDKAVERDGRDTRFCGSGRACRGLNGPDPSDVPFGNDGWVRGILVKLVDGLGTALSESDAMEEIRKEYTKEFMCEGQLYYFFKRLNYEQIPIPTALGNTVSYNYAVPRYVFPLPDDEIEYGGREKE